MAYAMQPINQCYFTLNEKADEEAKRAAKGQPSTNTLLPKPLKIALPHSVSALQQHQKAKIQKKMAMPLEGLTQIPQTKKHRQDNTLHEVASTHSGPHTCPSNDHSPTLHRSYWPKQTPSSHQTY